MRFNSRKGFTLIELLVVILILGILVAVALPSYMGSVKASRTNTANNNARAIATAIKAAQVKNGAASLATYADLTDASTLGELGGIPTNPCTGTATAGDYTITASGSNYTVQAATSSNCNATAVYTVYP